MRGLGVAICVGLGASSAALAEPTAFPTFPTKGSDQIEWVVDNIDFVPAAHVWTDTELLVWVRRETIKRQDGTARAWFVWEALSEATVERNGGRSLVVLKEFRCAEGQSRTLAMSVYKGNNLMGGLVRSFDAGPTPWIYDRPGMLGEAQRKTACERDLDAEARAVADDFINQRTTPHP